MVPYWGAVGAMYGCKDGVLYIHFGDRADPNAKSIRAASKGGEVEIVGQSWIVLRHLFVQGGQSCVTIKGPKADHNVVENCWLVNASERVSVLNAAATVIRNNDITADFYSDKCVTGAWGDEEQGGNITDELGLKYLFYAEYKMFFGPNSTSDYGNHLSGGTDNEVHGNRVSRGGQGIHVSQTTNTRIHHNTVEGMSSIGIIATMDTVVNVQIHDNLIMDCNIGCRIHHVNEIRQTAPRNVFLYRNRFWQKPGVGTGLFFHYHDRNDAEPYLHPHISIYHNSFAGGSRGAQLSAYADRLGGVPNALVVNNAFSNPVPIYTTSRFNHLDRAWTFDYNWLGGTGKSAAVWCGPHNVDAKGQTIWDTSKAPDTALPANSKARNTGLDLSTPFELEGRKFPPMPGMESGYFTGAGPDIGSP